MFDTSRCTCVGCFLLLALSGVAAGLKGPEMPDVGISGDVPSVDVDAPTGSVDVSGEI